MECESNADCLQGGIDGHCLPSSESASMFCAFPDPGCASGNRWGVLAGDGLAKDCVLSPGEADAGADAASTVPDAATVDAETSPADAAASSDATTGAWSTASLVAGVNTTGIERDPSLSANGLELYFSSIPGSNLGEISVATRPSLQASFAAGQPIAVLNTSSNELSPDITGDGLELFFTRVGTGIMVSKRASLAAAWGAPAATGLDGSNPSISHDGLSIYFTKSGACSASCLMVATRASRAAAWGPPTEFALPGGLKYLSSDISKDGLSLLISNPSQAGQAAILLVTRPTLMSPWTNVESIPSISFAASNEASSWGFGDLEIYFNAMLAVGGVGNEDLFVSVYQ